MQALHVVLAIALRCFLSASLIGLPLIAAQSGNSVLFKLSIGIVDAEGTAPLYFHVASSDIDAEPKSNTSSSNSSANLDELNVGAMHFTVKQYGPAGKQLRECQGDNVV